MLRVMYSNQNIQQARPSGVSHYLKGILHPKLKILKNFPYEVPDVYNFLSSVEHKLNFLEKETISLSIYCITQVNTKPNVDTLKTT